jgi:DNA-binding XRE family transcriptional regulator
MTCGGVIMGLGFRQREVVRRARAGQNGCLDASQILRHMSRRACALYWCDKLPQPPIEKEQNAFRILRKSLGLSQTQAGEALGVPQFRISVIEASARQPSFAHIQKLVKWALDHGLDVDVDSLFGE